MIKDINKLNEKHISFISDFILNCTIEEKIDAYYVCVNIISKNKIQFYKSNNQQLTRIDTIINEMWQNLINDWTYFKLINEDWFYSHIGYKIYMFYLPIQKPLMTEYDKNVHYIIDRIEVPTNDILVYSDCADEMKDMQYLDKFGISFKNTLKKYDVNIEDIVREIHTASSQKDSYDFNELFQGIINYNDSKVFALNEPEGYIIKHNKHVYQIINEPEVKREVRQYRTQYEFFLIDFIKFWNEIKDISRYIDNNDNTYCNIVCELFNDYINQREKVTHYIENNIDVNGLEPPCVGHRFEMCFKNIPNDLTISICKENIIYEDIFKVLLINLKKEKNIKHCVFMNQRFVDSWNQIVRTIENACSELK